METQQQNGFWFGKRVLVTGGDGFVASHLINYLSTQGALPVMTVRHRRPMFTLELIKDKNSSEKAMMPDIEQCDLLDYEALRRVCDRHQIDTIFHLAASAIVSDAANSPVSTIENNVMGTLNILEIARINKIPRVLIASTDKSYGDHLDDSLEPLPYREGYALRGMDVYSASKVCADMLTQTYSYQFKVPAIVVRSSNIFGPGDLNFTRLIPRTIMCLLAGKAPLINQGNEKVLREYIYIDDVVRAYTFLMEKVSEIYGADNCHMPHHGSATYGWTAFNVGNYTAAETADPQSCDSIKNVSEIIELLRKKITDIPPVVKAKAANFIEIPDQYLDCSKIINLGFRPHTSFADGLQRSIDWYRENYSYLEKRATRYVHA